MIELSIEQIKKVVIEQIKRKNIKVKRINILEKPYGFIVQIDDEWVSHHYNIVFDKEGEMIAPLGPFYGDTGTIYSTEILEGINEKGEKESVPITPSVLQRELDAHHFIIPRAENRLGGGNLLFYIDEYNEISYKGFIEGEIKYELFLPEEKLMQEKLLLTEVTINREKEEKECFFYSWDLNRRISDKWSSLESSENPYSVAYRIMQGFRLPRNVADEILNFMRENDAWLGTLRINSEDNKHHLNFLSVIGLDGIPLLDLTYVLPDFSVGTIALEKQKMGEVDEKRLQLRQVMEQKMLELKHNQENMATNFFRANALGGEKRESLPKKEDCDGGEEINKLIMQTILPFYMR